MGVRRTVERAEDQERGDVVVALQFGVDEVRVQQDLADQTVLLLDVLEIDLVLETLYQLRLVDCVVAAWLHQLLQSPLELIDVNLLQRQLKLKVCDEPCLTRVTHFLRFVSFVLQSGLFQLLLHRVQLRLILILHLSIHIKRGYCLLTCTCLGLSLSSGHNRSP